METEQSKETKRKGNIGKVLEAYSYKPEFKSLMINLEQKYGEQIFECNGIGTQLDVSKMSKKFFGAHTTAEVSVDANANVSDKSVISHKIEMGKPLQLINSYYRLWKELTKNRSKEYAAKIIESQINGRIYVNDFSGFSSGLAYCFNYSTYDTALLGIPSVFDGRGGSQPPKSLMAFLGQIELFSLIAGNSTLGATGLADLLIVISIYMNKIIKTGKDAHFTLTEVGEEFEYETTVSEYTSNWDAPRLGLAGSLDTSVKIGEHRETRRAGNYWQYLESILTGFIYRLNQPYRGSQSLFSNVSVYDDLFLDQLCPSYKLEIDGILYKADKEIVKKVQDIYLNIMNTEMERKPLTFPVTTGCLAVDEEGNIKDKKFLEYISIKNLKFGFINMYCGKTSTLSSCCRLRSERDNEYFNSFGAGSTKIGSLGVCTGNLPQLAVLSKGNKEQFLANLKQLVIDCQEVNNAKRNIIKRAIKANAQPLYSLGYMELKKQYSTFGVIGLYESLKILGLDIKSEEGQIFAFKMLDIINTTNTELQKRFKAPHNCEQIPGENVSVKLAKKDRFLGYNTKYTLYSNQFIPLIERTNMLDRIQLQGKFDKCFSGGAICHLNLDQEVKDSESMANLIEYAAKHGVVYFAINYVLQECENGHMSVGNVEVCPHCGGAITGKYTRVVGFLTKVDNWIKERKEYDFPNRQFYKGIETE